MDTGVNTTIEVLWTTCGEREFWCIIHRTMTTGKRFSDRTKDHSEQRVIDARTRAVLNAVASLPKGKALDGYLRATRSVPR